MWYSLPCACSELLCFLFETANAYIRHLDIEDAYDARHEEPVVGIPPACAPASEFPDALAVAGATALASTGGASANQTQANAATDYAGTLPRHEVPSNAYLRRIVRPVYDCVFNETFSGLVKGRPVSKKPEEMPQYPLNYDDWNEGEHRVPA